MTGDPARVDVAVVGAGHNGLVAATLLARAGLSVTVLEATDVVGGAARTESPFPRVPGLRQSTGAYLLGLFPPELAELLELRLPLLRRNPHYFLPSTVPGRYLLFGADEAVTRRQLTDRYGPADLAAYDALQRELAQLRDDLAPAWLAEPRSAEETAQRYLRPALREAFVGLVRGSVAGYLDRFGFAAEELVAMYAVTDGLSGLTGGPDTPGSGHNFLVHNMCRLPGAGGTWMIVRGGMGTVTGALADRARAAGATVRTGAAAAEVGVDAGTASGVVLADGSTVRAPVVLACCDPFRLPALLGDRLPSSLADRLTRIARPGSTLKVNLALRDLPRFRCLPREAPSPFGATVHLLPESSPMAALRQMATDVAAGRLPAEPTVEWYLHTTVDPSLRDPAGHHSSALFVQSVPFQPAGSCWAAEIDRYLPRLLDLCDRFAPGTSALVDDVDPLPPPEIERRFGISHGHIHHVDNAVSFTDRVPYATGLPGLYAGSAGCHPAGSVIGAAGHNAANRILRDLGRPPTGLSARPADRVVRA